MTEMVHAPAAPPWRRRIPATLAVLAALSVKILPSRWRGRARIHLARCCSWLPAASPQHVRGLYDAVVACQPAWWPGQIDCKERALATVLATALTGRRCHLVMGARCLPDAFHAWVAAADGTQIGVEEGGGSDHPWEPVYTSP
ncbi:Transglutaminase-like superfamily [Streptomyces noursei ATCC 11455]|nr:Transglutaminase-like superfamily [Streptomyces noursei ATCC 11455]ANZ21892.1 Transglutaminase-like superfamily [Streptomyces noursei ATCC 11455]